jgi:hypothetical protein
MDLSTAERRAVWRRVRNIVCRHGLPRYVAAWPYRSGDDDDPDLSEVTRRLRAYHPHTMLYVNGAPEGLAFSRKLRVDADRSLRRSPDFAFNSRSRIGTVTLHTCAGLGLSDKEFEALKDRHARLVHRTLDTWLSSGLRGLILDFRRHHGGSFYPLMYGFSRLLVGVPLFAWTRGTADVPRRGWLVLRDDSRFTEAGEHRGKNALSIPLHVALILGPETSSSGELAAAMFATKDKVRSFGAPTSGALSVNEGFRVRQGIELMLTDRLVTLSDGASTERLVPDVRTQRPMEAARSWLLAVSSM